MAQDRHNPQWLLRESVDPDSAADSGDQSSLRHHLLKYETQRLRMTHIFATSNVRSLGDPKLLVS